MHNWILVALGYVLIGSVITYYSAKYGYLTTQTDSVVWKLLANFYLWPLSVLIIVLSFWPGVCMAMGQHRKKT